MVGEPTTTTNKKLATSRGSKTSKMSQNSTNKSTAASCVVLFPTHLIVDGLVGVKRAVGSFEFDGAPLSSIF